MADSSAFDTSPVTVGDRPNAALIAEEIKNYAPNWAEAMKIPFWKAVSQQTTKDNAYKSVEEFFARKKINPSWIKLDRLCEGQMCGFFGYKGCLLSKLWDTVQEVHKFLNTVSEEVSRPDKSAKEVRQALSEHVEKLVPPLLLDLFPHDFEWHLQSLYMDLATPNDTEVLSSIFYRYFKSSFPFTSNKSMCLPTLVSQGSDLVLYTEEGKNNTIFLVCEYEDAEHKDLLKLMDTLQSVILTRVQRYPSASNNAMGVLCRGNKMTMFLMLYNQTSNDFTCSFLAQNQTDLYTALIDLENIRTLLHCNIVIMIAGKTLYLGPSQCHDTDLNNNEKNQNTKDEKEEERHQLGGIFEKLTSDKLQQRKYIVQEMLSTKVYQVYFNDQDYVAKFYFTSEAKSREELILEKLSNKFLKPVDSFKISDGIRCVIFPYIENCSWLKQHEFVEDVRSVLLALAELHEKKIAHSLPNVKPQITPVIFSTNHRVSLVMETILTGMELTVGFWFAGNES